jgi:tRNA 2-thiouridine synthesizing protein A
MNYDHLLDVTGLRCPVPIIRTKSTISKLTNNEKLLVVVTDPSYIVDCKVFIRQTGHLLLQSWQEDEKLFFIIQKAAREAEDSGTSYKRLG